MSRGVAPRGLHNPLHPKLASFSRVESKLRKIGLQNKITRVISKS